VEALTKRRTNVFSLIRKRADETKPKNLVYKGIVNNIHPLEGDLTDTVLLANKLDQTETRLRLSSGITILCGEVFSESNRNSTNKLLRKG
jgi:hypothetical protein